MAMTSADRPKVPHQFQLAEVSINADRKKSVIQDGTRADVEVSAVIRPVSDSYKRTPQSDSALCPAEPTTPSFHRFTSTKRTLIGRGHRAIKLQNHGSLAIEKSQTEGASDAVKSSALNFFADRE